MGEVGFEPTNSLRGQIYSLLPLAARPFPLLFFNKILNYFIYLSTTFINKLDFYTYFLLLVLNKMKNNFNKLIKKENIINLINAKKKNLTKYTEVKVLCLDLGSYSSYIYHQEEGLILRGESSCVSFIKKRGSYIPYLFGNKAKDMIGKVPFDIKIEKIKENNKIQNTNVLEIFLNEYFKEIYKNSLKKDTIISSINSNTSDLEKSNLIEVFERCGFLKKIFIPELILCSIGAGIDIKKPNSFIVLNITNSKTEIGIITLGFILKIKTLDIGGLNLNLDIKKYITNKYKLNISEQICEDLKKTLGVSFTKKEKLKQTIINGRDLNSGKMQSKKITNLDISIAVSKSLLDIAVFVKDFTDNVPIEFTLDVKKFGILLCGGLVNLNNLDLLISKITNLSTFIPKKPEEANIRGLSIITNNFDYYKSIFINYQ